MYAKTLNLVISHRNGRLDYRPEECQTKLPSTSKTVKLLSWFGTWRQNGISRFANIFYFHSWCSWCRCIKCISYMIFCIHLCDVCIRQDVIDLGKARKQKDMEGLYLCVELFSWQANPKEPVPPKPNSIAVLMWSKQRKCWKQHRFFMSFLVYWYKKWSCWANRSFDESLERSPSDCGVFVRYTSGSTGPPKALVEEICAHESQCAEQTNIALSCRVWCFNINNWWPLSDHVFN